MINTTNNNILLHNPKKSAMQHSFLLSPCDQDT